MGRCGPYLAWVASWRMPSKNEASPGSKKDRLLTLKGSWLAEETEGCSFFVFFYSSLFLYMTSVLGYIIFFSCPEYSFVTVFCCFSYTALESTFHFLSNVFIASESKRTCSPTQLAFRHVSSSRFRTGKAPSMRSDLRLFSRLTKPER